MILKNTFSVYIATTFKCVWNEIFFLYKIGGTDSLYYHDNDSTLCAHILLSLQLEIKTVMKKAAAAVIFI